MIRIFHAADLHLDSPFQGLSERQSALRRREQRELLIRLCTLAEESGAQLFLLSGDLLDSAQIYSQTVERLAEALGRLKMPVFIAPGNHDFYTARSPYARLRLPENVHIFTRPQLSCAALPELGVRVWGAGYGDSACPPLLRDFAMAKEPDTLDVLTLHGEVTSGEGRYCPITPAQLAASGFDYAALGHVHRSGGLQRSGTCWYAWPGCPEGRGFDECGEKGALLVDLGAGDCRCRFLPVGTRRYEDIRVEAKEDALAAVLECLPADTERDIYRITLCGEAAAPDLAALRRGLEGRFFALTLRDETTLPRDLWARQEENNLHGLFLRRLRAKYEAAAGEEERRLILQAVRAGLAALDGGEDEL